MSTIAKPNHPPSITPDTHDGSVPSSTSQSVIGLTKKQLLTQTTHRRDQATKLLASLLDAKNISERNLASIHQDDLLKRVTGRSSMDNAIASTRKLIDSFNRVIDDLRRNLTDEDLALL